MAEIIGGGAADDLLKPDGIAARVQGERVEEMGECVTGPRLPVVAGTAFAVDHAALSLDLGGIEGLAVGEFPENGETLLQPGGVGARHVEAVDRVRGVGEGADIGAKSQAVPSQHADNAVAREEPGAIEGHVFDKVRETALLVLLVKGTGEDDEPQDRAAAGFGVGPDDVAQPVGQSPGLEGWIRLQVAFRLQPHGGLGRNGTQQEQEEEDKAARGGHAPDTTFARAGPSRGKRGPG